VADTGHSGPHALLRHRPAQLPSLTRGPHPGPGPGALQLTAIAVHTPAVAGAAVALEGRVVSMFITLGDKQPQQPGLLPVGHPHRSKDVLTLLLAPGFLHLCWRQAKGSISQVVCGVHLRAADASPAPRPAGFRI
jgi:hypothetical protein